MPITVLTPTKPGPALGPIAKAPADYRGLFLCLELDPPEKFVDNPWTYSGIDHSCRAGDCPGFP